MHHGDCVGADQEAAEFCLAQGFSLVCHPPVDEAARAFTRGNMITHAAKTHLARNRDIVDSSDVLVACPPTKERLPRGGTWYTIDYARKKGLRMIVIAPDGSAEHVEARA